MKHDKDSEKFDDVTTETINLKPASKNLFWNNEIKYESPMSIQEAVQHLKQKLANSSDAYTPMLKHQETYTDKLPSGEPCREDEVAGLGWLNFGRYDPFRKPAVLHDRLYDGIIAGTSDITQDQADKMFLHAMLAEADHHQLGYARSIFRYGIVRLVSFFRRVGK